MSVLLYLIPISLGLGAIGLAAFLWSLKAGQYEDLDGAAERILLDETDTPDTPDTPADTAQAPPDGDATTNPGPSKRP
ncbi:MAG TPA: cbb3-type cytochrome oxidase assembly protein CcoS [Thermohalobaculum sp.]|nr:cbb3-type cytochrome oxidase assembly protein CcoS [Thermohalobaculum sp.]